MVDAWAVAAVTVSLLVFALMLLYGYNALAEKLYPQLAARFEVKHLRFIPVIADEGTVTDIGVSLSAAMLPLWLYARRRVSALEALEDQMSEFLAIYASIAASSRTTEEALRRAAELMGEPLRGYVERMARAYRVTGDLEAAYRVAFARAPRRVRLLARSIVSTARSGGNPARVLAVTAAYSRELRRLTKLTKSRLGEYSFVVSLASLTYAVSAGVVLYLVKTMAGARLPGLGTANIDTGVLMGMYYYALLMIVVASAVVIARVIHGHAILAPKYIALLLLASTAAFLAAPLLLHAPHMPGSGGTTAPALLATIASR